MGGEARDGLAPPAVSHFGLCRAGLAALRLPCLAGTIPTAHEPVLKLESPAPRARNVIAQGNALGELCTKSLFVSPPQRTNDNSPAVHCWEHEQETHVSPGSGRLKRSPLDALFFNRPLHGLSLTFRCYPSDKSLAIFSRPLMRTERSALLVQSSAAHPYRDLVNSHLALVNAPALVQVPLRAAKTSVRTVKSS